MLNNSLFDYNYTVMNKTNVITYEKQFINLIEKICPDVIKNDSNNTYSNNIYNIYKKHTKLPKDIIIYTGKDTKKIDKNITMVENENFSSLTNKQYKPALDKMTINSYINYYFKTIKNYNCKLNNNNNNNNNKQFIEDSLYLNKSRFNWIMNKECFKFTEDIDSECISFDYCSNRNLLVAGNQNNTFNSIEFNNELPGESLNYNCYIIDLFSINYNIINRNPLTSIVLDKYNYSKYLVSSKGVIAYCDLDLNINKSYVVNNKITCSKQLCPNIFGVCSLGYLSLLDIRDSDFSLILSRSPNDTLLNLHCFEERYVLYSTDSGYINLVDTRFNSSTLIDKTAFKSINKSFIKEFKKSINYDNINEDVALIYDKYDYKIDIKNVFKTIEYNNDYNFVRKCRGLAIVDNKIIISVGSNFKSSVIIFYSIIDNKILFNEKLLFYIKDVFYIESSLFGATCFVNNYYSIYIYKINYIKKEIKCFDKILSIFEAIYNVTYDKKRKTIVFNGKLNNEYVVGYYMITKKELQYYSNKCNKFINEDYEEDKDANIYENLYNKSSFCIEDNINLR